MQIATFLLCHEAKERLKKKKSKKKNQLFYTCVRTRQSIISVISSFKRTLPKFRHGLLMHFRNCITAWKNVMIHAPCLHLKIDSTGYYHVAERSGGKHREDVLHLRASHVKIHISFDWYILTHGHTEEM